MQRKRVWSGTSWSFSLHVFLGCHVPSQEFVCYQSFPVVSPIPKYKIYSLNWQHQYIPMLKQSVYHLVGIRPFKSMSQWGFPCHFLISRSSPPKASKWQIAIRNKRSVFRNTNTVLCVRMYVVPHSWHPQQNFWLQWEQDCIWYLTPSVHLQYTCATTQYIMEQKAWPDV